MFFPLLSLGSYSNSNHCKHNLSPYRYLLYWTFCLFLPTQPRLIRDIMTDTTYDWFTFYLRTTYVCCTLVVWAMDQPKQCYTIFQMYRSKISINNNYYGENGSESANSDLNFVVDQFFIKIHCLILLSCLIFFCVAIRTNYLSNAYLWFEILFLTILILLNVGLYYYNFIRKTSFAKFSNVENNSDINDAEQNFDYEANFKTLKIIFWIIALVIIGSMIVSPSYIFTQNQKLINNASYSNLYLLNINNELLLSCLVLLLFNCFLDMNHFFPTNSVLNFNGDWSAFLANFRNTFKLYVLMLILMTFIASKSKSNFLFLVYILCISTSLLSVFFGKRILARYDQSMFIGVDNNSNDDEINVFDIDRNE